MVIIFSSACVPELKRMQKNALISKHLSEPERERSSKKLPLYTGDR